MMEVRREGKYDADQEATHAVALALRLCRHAVLSLAVAARFDSQLYIAVESVLQLV